MTTVFLIRHGLTGQTGTTLYGRTPGIPLDHRGLAQAQRIADRFAGVKLTAVYSSPLERCVQTVESLAAAQRLEVREHPGLLEMDAGSWTGKPLKRLRHLKAWKEVQTSPATFRFPGGGEGFQEASERVVGTLRELAGRHRSGRIAVGTHGDIVRLLLNHFVGAPLDAFQRMIADTASVSVVVMSSGGEGRVLLMNDTVGDLARFGPGGTDAPWEAAEGATGGRRPHTPRAPNGRNLRG